MPHQNMVFTLPSKRFVSHLSGLAKKQISAENSRANIEPQDITGKSFPGSISIKAQSAQESFLQDFSQFLSLLNH